MTARSHSRDRQRVKRRKVEDRHRINRKYNRTPKETITR